MPYVIAPLDKVKGEGAWPEFGAVLKSVEDAGIKRAQETWQGYTLGGLYPGDRQFGMGGMRAREMAHDVTASTLSGTYSFRKNLGATGWHSLFDYTVRDDIIHAFAGFQISDEILNIIELRLEIGDRMYPIMNIEQAQGWGAFAILFKEDVGNELIAVEKTRVYVRGRVTATGYQTIVPLGYQLFKRKDLVISET